MQIAGMTLTAANVRSVLTSLTERFSSAQATVDGVTYAAQAAGVVKYYANEADHKAGKVSERYQEASISVIARTADGTTIVLSATAKDGKTQLTHDELKTNTMQIAGMTLTAANVRSVLTSLTERFSSAQATVDGVTYAAQINDGNKQSLFVIARDSSGTAIMISIPGKSKPGQEITHETLKGIVLDIAGKTLIEVVNAYTSGRFNLTLSADDIAAVKKAAGNSPLGQQIQAAADKLSKETNGGKPVLLEGRGAMIMLGNGSLVVRMALTAEEIKVVAHDKIPGLSMFVQAQDGKAEIFGQIGNFVTKWLGGESMLGLARAAYNNFIDTAGPSMISFFNQNEKTIEKIYKLWCKEGDDANPQDIKRIGALIQTMKDGKLTNKEAMTLMKALIPIYTEINVRFTIVMPGNKLDKKIMAFRNILKELDNPTELTKQKPGVYVDPEILKQDAAPGINQKISALETSIQNGSISGQGLIDSLAGIFEDMVKYNAMVSGKAEDLGITESTSLLFNTGLFAGQIMVAALQSDLEGLSSGEGASLLSYAMDQLDTGSVNNKTLKDLIQTVNTYLTNTGADNTQAMFIRSAVVVKVLETINTDQSAALNLGQSRLEMYRSVSGFIADKLFVLNPDLLSDEEKGLVMRIQIRIGQGSDLELTPQQQELLAEKAKEYQGEINALVKKEHGKVSETFNVAEMLNFCQGGAMDLISSGGNIKERVGALLALNAEGYLGADGQLDMAKVNQAAAVISGIEPLVSARAMGLGALHHGMAVMDVADRWENKGIFGAWLDWSDTAEMAVRFADILSEGAKITQACSALNLGNLEEAGRLLKAFEDNTKQHFLDFNKAYQTYEVYNYWTKEVVQFVIITVISAGVMTIWANAAKAAIAAGRLAVTAEGIVVTETSVSGWSLSGRLIASRANAWLGVGTRFATSYTGNLGIILKTCWSFAKSAPGFMLAGHVLKGDTRVWFSGSSWSDLGQELLGEIASMAMMAPYFGTLGMIVGTKGVIFAANNWIWKAGEKLSGEAIAKSIQSSRIMVRASARTFAVLNEGLIQPLFISARSFVGDMAGAGLVKGLAATGIISKDLIGSTTDARTGMETPGLDEQIGRIVGLIFVFGLTHASKAWAPNKSASMKSAAINRGGLDIFRNPYKYFSWQAIKTEALGGWRAVVSDAKIAELGAKRTVLQEKDPAILNAEQKAELRQLNNQLGEKVGMVGDKPILKGGSLVGETQLNREAVALRRQLVHEARVEIVQNLVRSGNAVDLNSLAARSKTAARYVSDAVLSERALTDASVSQIAGYNPGATSEGLTLRLKNGGELKLDMVASQAMKDSFLSAVSKGDAGYAAVFAPFLRNQQEQLDAIATPAVRSSAETLHADINKAASGNDFVRSRQTTDQLRAKADLQHQRANSLEADARKAKVEGKAEEAGRLTDQARQYRAEANKLGEAVALRIQIGAKLKVFNDSYGSTLALADTLSVDAILLKVVSAKDAALAKNYAAGKAAALGYLAAHPEGIGVSAVLGAIGKAAEPAAEPGQAPVRSVTDVEAFQGVRFTEAELTPRALRGAMEQGASSRGTKLSEPKALEFLYSLRDNGCRAIEYNGAQIELSANAQKRLADNIEERIGSTERPGGIVDNLRLTGGSMTALARYKPGSGLTENLTLKLTDGVEITLSSRAAQDLRSRMIAEEGTASLKFKGGQKIELGVVEGFVRGETPEALSGDFVTVGEGQLIINVRGGGTVTFNGTENVAHISIEGNTMRIRMSSGVDNNGRAARLDNVKIAERGKDGSWKPVDIDRSEIGQRFSAKEIMEGATIDGENIRGVIGAVTARVAELRGPNAAKPADINAQLSELDVMAKTEQFRQPIRDEIKSRFRITSDEVADQYINEGVNELRKGILGSLIRTGGQRTTATTILETARNSYAANSAKSWTISGEEGLVEIWLTKNKDGILKGLKQSDIMLLRSALAKDVEAEINEGLLAQRMNADKAEQANEVSRILGADRAALATPDASGRTLAQDIVDLTVEFKANNVSLRSGQLDTLKVFVDKMATTDRARIFIENPTAAGKTIANIFITKLMVARGKQVDLFMPNDPLVEQFFNQFIPSAGVRNRDLLAIEFGGKDRGVVGEGKDGNAVRFDIACEAYNKSQGGKTAAEMVDILENKMVLVYTEKSLFLRQQARTKEGEGHYKVVDALEARMQRTSLVVDEAHLYMKNTMDLIMSGESTPISNKVFDQYANTHNQLVAKHILNSDGTINKTELGKVISKELGVDMGAHIRFSENTRIQWEKEGINIAVAESIVSGARAMAGGKIKIGMEGESGFVKPISDLTGQIEYTRQFQDVFYILGAGKAGRLEGDALRRAADQSKTSSAEGLFTIINGYNKIIAASGTPPGEPVLDLWGFELHNLGFKGGVKMQFEHTAAGNEIQRIVEIALAKCKTVGETGQVVIAHDNATEIVKVFNDMAATATGRQLLREAGIDPTQKIRQTLEGEVSFLSVGGFEGRLFVTNKISMLGVDFQTDLVLITGGKAAESLIRQGKGRPSRNGEYGEFIVVGEKEWIQNQSKGIRDLIGDSTNKNLPKNIKTTLEHLEKLEKLSGNDLQTALDTLGVRDINDIKLQLVQQYMDAKAEGSVYVQTVTQYLRDTVIKEVAVRCGGQEAVRKLMDIYFDKETEVSQAGEYQVAGEGQRGFGGREQLKMALESTRESLKRALRDARFEVGSQFENARDALVNKLIELDFSGNRTTTLKSLEGNLSLQDIVDVGFKHADKIIPIDILSGMGRTSVATVQKEVARSGKTPQEVLQQYTIADKAGVQRTITAAEANRMVDLITHLNALPPSSALPAGFVDSIGVGEWYHFAAMEDDTKNPLSIGAAADKLRQYAAADYTATVIGIPSNAINRTVTIAQVQAAGAAATIFRNAGYTAQEAQALTDTISTLSARTGVAPAFVGNIKISTLSAIVIQSLESATDRKDAIEQAADSAYRETIINNLELPEGETPTLAALRQKVSPTTTVTVSKPQIVDRLTNAGCATDVARAAADMMDAVATRLTAAGVTDAVSRINLRTAIHLAAQKD
ncbi:MAG: DEAD/DEAH box helicase family protein, partial [Candidatus Omnitrophica bacterium]|nr:DEAD/DEAH box helicase family protein [Candidatus Omnitrophota bacterium]